jgi:hypothetical protein
VLISVLVGIGFRCDSIRVIFRYVQVELYSNGLEHQGSSYPFQFFDPLVRLNLIHSFPHSTCPATLVNQRACTRIGVARFPKKELVILMLFHQKTSSFDDYWQIDHAIYSIRNIMIMVAERSRPSYPQKEQFEHFLSRKISTDDDCGRSRVCFARKKACANYHSKGYRKTSTWRCTVLTKQGLQEGKRWWAPFPPTCARLPY